MGADAMPGGVFISYRRNDNSGTAGRINDRLKRRFGAKKVFFDRDDIPASREWRDVLAGRVEASDVLVAVIGRHWNPPSEILDGRRLDDPDDNVRIEIERCLERDIPIVPVLIDGAMLPQRKELPNGLKRLLDWQALEVVETRFDYDIQKLCRSLSTHVRAKPLWPVAVLAGAAVAFFAALVGYYFYLNEIGGKKQNSSSEEKTTPVCSFAGKWDCLKCGNNEAIAYKSSVGGKNHVVEMRQNGVKIDGIFDTENNIIIFDQFPLNRTIRVTGKFTPDCKSISWEPLDWVWTRPAAN